MQDQFTVVIDKSIRAMLRMVDTMESLNRVADMPDMGNSFMELRQDVSLAQHALDQFNDDLARTDKQASTVRQMGSSFDLLGKSIIVANQGLELIQKAWSGISKLGSTSDARIGSDARLGNILDGLRTQEQLEQQVMKAANASRGEYAATAELIARVGRQDYFKGNNDAALAFAETLNKGLVVSGASAMEAQSALIQLSQGLASGVLRGEEFNSIMENGSVIAEMMATSLGVTKGELRAMAEDGQLTTEVVVSSIMGQAGAIDQQFATMPMTYGQAMNQMSNLTSRWMDQLAQPGMAIDVIITSLENVAAWAATADGTQFFSGMANGVTAVVSGIATLSAGIADIYLFFSNNWSTMEPILWGIATAVGGMTAAYLIFKGVALAVATAKAIMGAATMLSTGATIADTAAQWGLNAAMLASPVTWIILAIIALIAIIVALTIWIIDLWNNNIDFKVGVIKIWNSILGFFDQIPIFFQGIGYGIADAFSHAKVLFMQILQSMVNGAINMINKLIEFVNMIPGVSIGTISEVTFGTETALEEEAKRAERAAKLAESKAAVAAKAAGRDRQLAEDSAQWRADAETKKAKAEKAGDSKMTTGVAGDNSSSAQPLTLKGGSIDSVGKIGNSVDISDQSLQYLNDIAEVRLLQSVESTAGLKLSSEDAALMQASATTADTNVYYIQYSGGVKIKNDVKRGEDWETIRRQLEEESQNEINTGISDIEEVVFGG